MSEQNIANQIARQLYAMAAKKRDTNLAEKMRDERYQRTFTDEYPWNGKKLRAGLERVPEEVKRIWARLAEK